MSRVLRVARTDRASEFVLIHVQHIGPATLDLRLVGTDGENPFVTQVRQKTVRSLRSSNYHGTDDDWVSTLSALLLHQEVDSSVVQGLETVASVAADSINVSIRKNVSGITQRLGSITLALEEEEPIELFEWAGLAAKSASESQTQVLTLQQSLLSQQSTVQRLTVQLEELVRAKKEHEDELLKKFAALLNSKKLKIRDQQRLLAHAKVDPQTASQIRQTRATIARKPNTSRAGKRKANASANASETDDDDDDEEHAAGSTPSTRMIVDEDADEPITPEQSDLEQTDADDTDSDEFAAAPVASKTSRRARTKNDTNSATQEKSRQPSDETAELQPPPRRELPFARKNTNQPAPQENHSSQTSAPPPKTSASTAAELDETEDETDDEL